MIEKGKIRALKVSRVDDDKLDKITRRPTRTVDFSNNLNYRTPDSTTYKRYPIHDAKVFSSRSIDPNKQLKDKKIM